MAGEVTEMNHLVSMHAAIQFSQYGISTSKPMLYKLFIKHGLEVDMPDTTCCRGVYPHKPLLNTSGDIKVINDLSRESDTHTTRKGLVACYASVCSWCMKSLCPKSDCTTFMSLFTHPFHEITFKK